MLWSHVKARHSSYPKDAPSKSCHYVRAPLPYSAGRRALGIFCNMGQAADARPYLKLEQYIAPGWAPSWLQAPPERFVLGHFPTPIHEWSPPGVPEGTKLHIKRDDMTGMQLSGNKVRKLEYLVADALANKVDTLVTIGGIQSNHCRTTAVAARHAGLECHLLLRNSQQAAERDPGMVGNLLVDRLVGAHIHQVTKEEYARVGSAALGEQLKAQLEAAGRRPCVIPVGGSSALGTWGYLAAMEELVSQAGKGAFTDIVMACGSGGTTAGIALGNYLSGFGARVHGYGVCDDPEYFYDFIQGIFDDLGATADKLGKSARDLVTLHQAKGAGYAISKPEELQTISELSQCTGIILDGVYGGKAWHAFLADMQASPEEWRDRRVLFLHTGGLLGIYAEAAGLQAVLQSQNRAHRHQVPAVSGDA